MKLTVTERRCEKCNADIGHKRSDARYCSKKCRDSPQFWGAFCAQCGEKLLVKRESTETKHCSRKCITLAKNPDFNEDFFANPNPTSSYWAGFIAADGCVYLGGDRHKLTIALKSTDEQHLRNLQSSIGAGSIQRGTSYSKERDKTYYNARYSLYSEKICNDLESVFNIHSRKSLTLKPPNVLAREESLAFIAGYIDGDGSYTNNGPRPVLKIVGTKQILEWIVNFYGLDAGWEDRGNHHVVHFSANNSLKIRDSFCGLSIPFLERKRNRWEGLGLDLNIKPERKRKA